MQVLTVGKGEEFAQNEGAGGNVSSPKAWEGTGRTEGDGQVNILVATTTY